jgi:DNA-binding transcriptional ArsR family regulator
MGYLTDRFIAMPDPLSTTFSALADPTRRAILARLALGETSVTELAEPFDMSLPAVSKHLKVLEHAGLIARGREAQWRPCRIAPASLKQVDGWLESYRRFWDESFNRLDDYLQALQAQEKLKERHPAKSAKRNAKSKAKKEKQHGHTSK